MRLCTNARHDGSTRRLPPADPRCSPPIFESCDLVAAIEGGHQPNIDDRAERHGGGKRHLARLKCPDRMGREHRRDYGTDGYDQATNAKGSTELDVTREADAPTPRIVDEYSVRCR